MKRSLLPSQRKGKGLLSTPGKLPKTDTQQQSSQTDQQNQNEQKMIEENQQLQQIQTEKKELKEIKPKRKSNLLQPKTQLLHQTQTNKPNQSTQLIQMNKTNQKEEDKIIKIYKILHTKNTQKKHKTFDDGYLIIKSNNIGYLHDDEDKLMTKIQNIKKEIPENVTDGEQFIISSRIIEINEEIPIEHYISGKLFLRQTPMRQTTEENEEKKKKGFQSLLSSKQQQKLKKKKGKEMEIEEEENENDNTNVNQKQPEVFLLKKSTLGNGKLQKKKVALYSIDNPYCYVVDNSINPPILIDPYLGKHLRPHQVEGIRFMYNCIKRGKDNGCLLADEMGLGKTIQTIGLIWTVHKQCNMKKIIVVCPQSLIGNWEREFKKWLGIERLNLQIGSSDKEMKQKVNDFTKDYIPVLIISYEQVRSHYKTLKETKINLMVCDEGHRIKNLMSKTNVSLKSLGAEHTIILSGTPVQNGLEEFYSLLEFCSPGCLGNSTVFKRVFATPIEKAQDGNATQEEITIGKERAKELTMKINDYVLRRTSKVNEKYLSDKKELMVFIPLNELQKQLYLLLLKKMKMNKFDQCIALQYLQLLTKLCNHPQLINPFLEEHQIDLNQYISSYIPCKENTERNELENDEELFIQLSNKFLFTITLIQKILQTTDEKIVVISNYTKTLDLFERYFTHQNELQNKENVFITDDHSTFHYLRLDGKTNQRQRDIIVENINDKSDHNRILLLSSKAGGVGLNLIGCSRLILFDPDWNPAKDKQAMSRIWRDGQKRICFIYRLFCTGTIEEKIYQRQLQKNQISESIIEEHLEMGKSLSMEQLLKVFQLNTETRCETHELLDCHCLDTLLHDERKLKEDHEIEKWFGESLNQMEIEELKENINGMKLNENGDKNSGEKSDEIEESRKHLVMEMKDDIMKIDPLLGMIENGEKFVSMIFVNEFHNPNAMK